MCRAGIACVYSAQPPTGRESKGALERTSKKPSEVRRFPLFTAARAIVAPLSSSESDSASEHSPNNRSSGPILAVHSAYEAVKDELPEILRLFSRSTNTWLPFVTESQLNTFRYQHEATLNIETIVLLLAIYLVTKEPPEDSSLETVYSVLKSTHCNLHSTNAQLIPIIQAGLLIALYEQGQALHRTSYMTIGAAVRLAQVAGFHKSINIDLDNAPVPRATLEQQRHVWWTAVLLER